MYGLVNEEMDFHTIKILTSLSAFGFILKDFFFLEPMSVSAEVVLLVRHDETLHDLIEFGNSWGLQTY
jgi:hypothetical protein